MNESRGVRNCNPLNIRPGKKKFRNELDPDTAPGGPFCRFPTPVDGLYIAGRLLLGYYADPPRGHGRKTIRAIINAWAPPEDDNPTTEYVLHVVAAVGIGPDDDCPVTDASVLSSLMMAMVRQEQGYQPYSVLGYERAASEAIGDGLLTSWGDS